MTLMADVTAVPDVGPGSSSQSHEEASCSLAAPPEDLGRLLDTLRRAYLERAALAFADVPAGARGIRVMQVADDGACSNQAGIASTLGIDRTVMTYLVDDLEAARLVTRRPDPADRRARQVVVTEAGHAVLRRVRSVMDDIERETLGALGPDDAAQLRALLERAARGMPSSDSCAGAPDVPSC